MKMAAIGAASCMPPLLRGGIRLRAGDRIRTGDNQLGKTLKNKWKNDISTSRVHIIRK
jgi:hypothetical protein